MRELMGVVRDTIDGDRYTAQTRIGDFEQRSEIVTANSHSIDFALRL
jgi:hypothetical protein